MLPLSFKPARNSILFYVSELFSELFLCVRVQPRPGPIPAIFFSIIIIIIIIVVVSFFPMTFDSLAHMHPFHLKHLSGEHQNISRIFTFNSEDWLGIKSS
jgi:hypothetical protein